MLAMRRNQLFIQLVVNTVTKKSIIVTSMIDFLVTVFTLVQAKLLMLALLPLTNRLILVRANG
jgi:hypothetical protein